MKKTKLFLTATIMLAVFSVSATKESFGGAKPKYETEKLNGCGVGCSEVIVYLQTCSHHHTVYSCSQITGTCDFTANVENGIVSTVYTSNGIIVGHADNGM